MLYIKLINIFFGSEVSKIISVPFFFSTLYISFNPLLRFSKFLTPYPTVTISKVSSAYFIFSASPISKLIFLYKFRLLIFLLPISIIFEEMSNPIISQFFMLDNIIAISAVPVAISNIFLGFFFLAISTISLFHLLCKPNVKRLLIKSY